MYRISCKLSSYSCATLVLPNHFSNFVTCQIADACRTYYFYQLPEVRYCSGSDYQTFPRGGRGVSVREPSASKSFDHQINNGNQILHVSFVLTSTCHVLKQIAGVVESVCCKLSEFQCSVATRFVLGLLVISVHLCMISLPWTSEAQD